MAKSTKADLEKEIQRLHELVELEAQKISALEQELEDTRKGLNMVSRAECNVAITAQEETQKLYESYRELHEREKMKHEKQIDMNVTLRKELESLKSEIEVLQQSKFHENSAEIKTERNERGAGRKPYQEIEVIEQILALYAEGASYQQVADYLNANDIKTKQGKPWAKSSIRLILINNIDKAAEDVQQLIKGRITNQN